MFDYTELATTAATMVTNFGRSVTLIDFNTTAADANKPWRGAANPRTTPAATAAVDAVFVDPSALSKLGYSTQVSDLVKNSQQVMIVASTSELTQYNEVLDSDSTRWKITTIEKLQPADTILLYFIGVKR